MAAPTDLKRVISSGAGAPRDGAAREIEEIAEHGLLADHAGGQRLQDVAGLAEGAGAGVDEDAGAAHHLVVGLAHVGPVGADAIDVRAGREPGAADQRLGGERGRGDDVGLAHGGLQVVGDADLEAGRAANAAASARARSGERFQMATWRIGRTEACARTSCGASAPAPTISRREASGRDR